MDRQKEQVLTGVDSGLHEGSQAILIDIDPDISVQFLQAAAALAGKPPPRNVPKEELVSTHNVHVKNLTAAKNEPRPVKKVSLSLAYHPSIKSIRELQKMHLSELLVEVHHEDKVLILKTVTLPYHGAGIVVVVEDETGAADKLAIYNQGEASLLSSPPLGSVVAIREPYYKFNGDSDFMLCVDHPSDIILVEPADPLFPLSFQQTIHMIAPETCLRCSTEGDNAFIVRNLPEAVRWYSRALDLATAEDEVLTSSLLAKRAGTNLALKCYGNVISDAMASKNGTCHDWKAYFTAGKAAYGLGNYQDSKAYFDQALEKSPGSAGIQKEQRRCLERLREEAEGSYDFLAMSQLVNQQNVNLDNASHFTKTRIADSPFHGRGLFASRDISPGELIFCEKATCMPNEYNIEHNGAALYVNMVQQCSNNVPTHSKTLELYGGSYDRTGFEGKMIDGNPVIDVFLLESIRRTNCFMSPHTSVQAAAPGWTIQRFGLVRGLWTYGASLNHSCRPNSNRSFIGDMMISRATEFICAGEEITQIYSPPKAVWAARSEQFVQWGFKCGCRLCAAEAKSSESSHEKRRELLIAIDAFILKTKKSKHSIQASTVRTVEKLIKKLEALHEEAVYGNIPRLLLIGPAMWLMDAHGALKNHSKTVKWAAQVLRNFGFLDVAKDGNWNVYEGSQLGTTAFEGVKALGYAKDAHEAMGNTGFAQQCDASARLGWRILMGFDAELPSRYSDYVGDEFNAT
ncbi:TPR domain-containing protein [Xylariales sp. AK1849]|nr:TPR domain-containing protein [Xylariales sp. AK1849]